LSVNRTGAGRSSDIAIDDIVLQGEPSKKQLLLKFYIIYSMNILVPLSTRTTSPRPTTTPRTRFNASCDFDIDKELCGWKSDTKYGWNVIHERQTGITIGPSSDYSSISMYLIICNYYKTRISCIYFYHSEKQR